MRKHLGRNIDAYQKRKTHQRRGLDLNPCPHSQLCLSQDGVCVCLPFQGFVHVFLFPGNRPTLLVPWEARVPLGFQKNLRSREKNSSILTNGGGQNPVCSAPRRRPPLHPPNRCCCSPPGAPSSWGLDHKPGPPTTRSDAPSSAGPEVLCGAGPRVAPPRGGAWRPGGRSPADL